MLDWLTILAGGFLGSAHCVGMCGGFALALGTTGRSLLGNLARQVIYGLGRVFTYAVGGTAAGFAGWRLTRTLDPVVNLQAVLAIGAGFLLVYQGLEATGVFRRFRAGGGDPPCLLPKLLAALLSATRLHSVFLAGMVNGFLPCGLVYAYLALAASAGDMQRGAAVMALFGAGTIPALALVGLGGSFLGLTCRRRVFLIAACCLVLTGLLSIARGFGFLHIPGLLEVPACHCCDT